MFCHPACLGERLLRVGHMLQNPNGPDCVEAIVRKWKRGGRAHDKLLVVVPCRRGCDIEPGVIVDDVLKVAVAGADIEHGLLLKVELNDEFADLVLNSEAAMRFLGDAHVK